MHISSQRFGAVEVEEDQILHFPEGIIGFPQEHHFVVLPHHNSGFLAWLQSTCSPALALPVVSGHAFGTKYPDIDLSPMMAAAGLGDDPDEVALLVVLCAPPGHPATVNLLAPVLVNAATRTGAQVILEGSKYTTRELFVREQPEAVKAQAAAE